MDRGTGSIWAMLYWKEWRQQRLAALLLGFFCMLLPLAYRGAFGQWAAPTDLACVLVFLASCLGASVFAGEAGDWTADFVARLPLSPWQSLLTKYAVAVGLTLLCAVPSALVYVLAAGTVPDSPWWSASPGLVVFFVLGAIALTGALARHGLGAMGSLMAGLGLIIAGGLLARLVGMALDLPKAGERAAYRLHCALLAGGVVHLWLLASWSGCRWLRPNRWRAAGWGVLLFSVPVLCGFEVIAHQRKAMDPRRLAPGQGFVSGAASPDGRTIALSMFSHRGWLTTAWGSWLLDTRTGQMRRVGPWWRDYSFTGCWSPDGSRAKFSARPMSLLALRVPFMRSREEIVRITQDGLEDCLRPRQVGSQWLGDGTFATYHRNAWEFTDGGAGKPRRCAFPPANSPIDRQWREAEKYPLSHAIVAAAIGEDPDGQPVCHYWRSTPELARTERHDLPLDPAVPLDLLGTRFSNNGRWLLLGQPSGGERARWIRSQLPRRNLKPERWRQLVERANRENRPLWLVSLVDGTCRRLELPGDSRRNDALFTPDSSLLVVPSADRLHIWNLTAARWEPGIALVPEPEPAETSPSPAYPWLSSSRSYAISPARPWRIAFGMERRERIQVANLEERTVTEPFPIGSPQGSTPWRPQISWFGNERLFIQSTIGGALRIVNADGTNCHQVLP